MFYFTDRWTGLQAKMGHETGMLSNMPAKNTNLMESKVLAQR